MDLYSNLSHINVNVLRPLCTCCVIIVLIVHKAVVKGQKGKSAFPGMVCLGVMTGVGGCSQNVIWTCTVRLYSTTSMGFSTNRHSEEVSRPFGAIAGDSWCLGSCTAAGWLGKGLSSANPGGAFASAQLSSHPPRPALPHHSHSPSAETSRRDSWPVLAQREEGGCVFTRVWWGLHQQ